MTTCRCEAVIFYDGVCAMCNGIVRFVLRRDPNGHFCFVALQSELARTLLAQHGETPDELDTMYLLTGYRGPDERLWARSDALLEALHRLGSGWSVLAWLRVLPKPVRDFAYSLVVRNRYRVFGKYDSCPLPPAEWRSRFIEPSPEPQINTDERG